MSIRIIFVYVLFRMCVCETPIKSQLLEFSSNSVKHLIVHTDSHTDCHTAAITAANFCARVSKNLFCFVSSLIKLGWPGRAGPGRRPPGEGKARPNTELSGTAAQYYVVFCLLVAEVQIWPGFVLKRH